MILKDFRAMTKRLPGTTRIALMGFDEMVMDACNAESDLVTFDNPIEGDPEIVILLVGCTCGLDIEETVVVEEPELN